MKKMTKFLVFAVALLVLCLSLTACGGSTKLNLSDYLSISYTGADGNASAVLQFDASQMELDYAGVEGSTPTEEELEKMLSLAPFELSISWDLDKSEGLSNGDQITATISYDSTLAEEAKVKIGSTTKTFTVEGLAEPIEVNPFAEDVFGAGKTVNFALEGIDPFVSLTLHNTAGNDDPIHYVTYQADKDWNLKNGDVITITATLDDQYAQQGYVLINSETTVTVEGFDRYVSTAADLTDTVLQSISDRVYQECVSRNDVNIYDGTNNLTPWGANIENIYVGDTALLLVNNNVETEYSFLLVPIYKTISTDEWYDMATGVTAAKTWKDVVAYYKVSNVIVHADGSVDFDDSYVDMYGSYTDADAANNLYLNGLASTYSTIEVPMP